MTNRMTLLTFAASLAAAMPLHAQSGHAGHAPAQGSDQSMMMCGMGGMQHGAGQMQQGAGQMQHGAGQMQHGAAGQMQQGGSMHEMMGGYAGNPGMILHHSTELGLSASQVERITALQQAAQQDCAQHMKLAHEQHAAATAALQAQTPNVATFEAKLREASQHMVQAHVAMARRGVEALSLLTAEQRTKLLANKHDGAGAQHKH